MKSIYFSFLFLLLPLSAAAQALSEPATYTYPLGKYFAVDSKVPIEIDEAAFTWHFTRYMKRLSQRMAENNANNTKETHGNEKQKTFPPQAVPQKTGQKTFKNVLSGGKTPSWPAWKTISNFPMDKMSAKKAGVAVYKQEPQAWELYRRLLDKKRLEKKLQRLLLEKMSMPRENLF